MALSVPDKQGNIPRDALRKTADKPRGGPFVREAQRRLTPPCEFPEELAYIERIARHLSQRSHVGMNGRERVTDLELMAYLHLRDRTLDAYEVDAVMMCADVLVFGAKQKTTQQQTEDDADNGRDRPPGDSGRRNASRQRT